jgi:hypothetical protein
VWSIKSVSAWRERAVVNKVIFSMAGNWCGQLGQSQCAWKEEWSMKSVLACMERSVVKKTISAWLERVRLTGMDSCVV